MSKETRFINIVKRYGTKAYVRGEKLGLTKYEMSDLLYSNFIKCSEIKDNRRLCRVLNINPSHIEGLRHIHGEFIRDNLNVDMNEQEFYRKLVQKDIIGPMRWVPIESLTFYEHITL